MKLIDRSKLIKVDVAFDLAKSDNEKIVVQEQKKIVAPGEFVYMQQMGVLRDGNDAFCVDIFLFQAEAQKGSITFGIQARDRAVKPDNSYKYRFQGEAYFAPGK